MVLVLVGQYVEMGEFSGYWAEFEGEKINSFERQDVVYTLYKCTAYRFDAYRVHTSDETDPLAPVYELHPYTAEQPSHPPSRDYTEPYDEETLANQYPFFIQHLGLLETRRIDPRPKNK